MMPFFRFFENTNADGSDLKKLQIQICFFIFLENTDADAMEIIDANE